MNQPDFTNDLADILNRARRIAFGAAASLVEILQDPQKREQNLKRLSEELGELADELAVKGQQTELEARRYVDRWLHPDQPETSSTESSPAPSSTSTALEDRPLESQPPLSSAAAEIHELTEQIHSLREELERLRGSDSEQF